jgi:hypothetical protein
MERVSPGGRMRSLPATGAAITLVLTGILTDAGKPTLHRFRIESEIGSLG